MNIKVLTSSRADFGIFIPLLTKMSKDKYFNTELIVFGTHLSKAHGYTIKEIQEYGFKIKYKIETLVKGDTPKAITESMALTTKKFSSVWKKEQSNTDLIICLGDRFEMHAAVLASVPFGIKIAHFHGGETSLGAIDNIFRHSISLMSEFHFTSTQIAARRVAAIIGENKYIYPVGALSLDKVIDLELMNKKEFKKKYNIPVDENTILVTFHPETKSKNSNKKYAEIIAESLLLVNNPVLITLPNADAEGEKIKKIFVDLGKKRAHTYVVNSLGARGYFSALNHCKFLLGNSSSGIIEAASFGKYAINLGDRQKGREAGDNVIHCSVNKKEIMKIMSMVSKKNRYERKNIYGDGKTADKIIKILKAIR
ncbi:MAG: UDP-N-acetylglucosamine 2-epimerase (hydrolyzing) [Cytophagaceae bacterium]|nr:UDP-N-acetylglucosamine 2-epimerase (hydrolyzing) [Cytophagaceae bacterium]